MTGAKRETGARLGRDWGETGARTGADWGDSWGETRWKTGDTGTTGHRLGMRLLGAAMYISAYLKIEIYF